MNYNTSGFGVEHEHAGVKTRDSHLNTIQSICYSNKIVVHLK